MRFENEWFLFFSFSWIDGLILGKSVERRVETKGRRLLISYIGFENFELSYKFKGSLVTTMLYFRAGIFTSKLLNYFPYVNLLSIELFMG